MQLTQFSSFSSVQSMHKYSNKVSRAWTKHKLKALENVLQQKAQGLHLASRSFPQNNFNPVYQTLKRESRESIRNKV